MQSLLQFAGRIDGLSRRLGRAVAWLTLLMVFVGAFNAVARYLERGIGTQLSSNAYIELQWYLFSLIFLLGAPYTLRCDRHVRVDVLYGGHTARAKAWIDLIGGLLLLLPFCLFGIWISWEFVADSIVQREVSSDPGGLLRYPLKAVVPVAFGLLGLQGLSEVIKRLAVLRGISPETAGLAEPTSDGAPAEGGTP